MLLPALLLSTLLTLTTPLPHQPPSTPHVHRRLPPITPQPSIPTFIDLSTCLCGLLLQESTLDVNGELIEMWRCTATLTSPITSGTNGKWYNTTLPSQERSGINQPRDWDQNPPYVNQTFVLLQQESGRFYELLSAANKGALFGGDVSCNGIKDGVASEAFYESQGD